MKEASLKAGLGETFVRDLLERDAKPGAEKLAALAVYAFGTTLDDLMGLTKPELRPSTSLARIMGYVGAGAVIEPEFEQVPEDGLDTIDLPFPTPEDVIAFQIRGNSMMPRYDDGDVVVVYRESRRAPEQFIGTEAVVRTADGRRFLKMIMAGNRPNRFTLMSFNAPPILGVKLAWIGEIFGTFRKGTIRRVEREISKTRRPA